MAALARLIDANELKPVIDQTYPLSECADAVRYLQTGRATGKVVLTVHLPSRSQPTV